MDIRHYHEQKFILQETQTYYNKQILNHHLIISYLSYPTRPTRASCSNSKWHLRTCIYFVKYFYMLYTYI